MAPKKQLTFAQSLAHSSKKKETTQAPSQPNDSSAPSATQVPSIVISESMIETKVLEDSFLMASTASLEVYRKNSPLSGVSHGQLKVIKEVATDKRESERIKRSRSDKDAKTAGKSNTTRATNRSLLDDDDDDDEADGDGEQGAQRVKAQRKRDHHVFASWRDGGLDLLSILSHHVSPTTSLQLQHQELLIHMVLNADFELNMASEMGEKIDATLMATRALSLLMDHATLHPPSKLDATQGDLLLVNKGTWTPDQQFDYEKGCYASVFESGVYTQIPKLMFFNGVLRNALVHSRSNARVEKKEVHARVEKKEVHARVEKKEVQKKRSKGEKEDDEREDRIGGVGSSMLLKLISHLLVIDYDAREEIYRKNAPGKDGGRSQVADGESNPASILSRSSLAQLISYKANAMNRSWTVWSSLVKDVMLLLIALILNGAPAGVVRQPTKVRVASASKKAKGGTQVSSPPGKNKPPVSQGGEGLEFRAFVTTGELGVMASSLLSRIMDLFLIMEEEKQYDSLTEDPDTESRFLTNFIFDKFITTKKEPKESAFYEVSVKLQDPRAKAVLLSSLSPRARLHLLGA